MKKTRNGTNQVKFVIFDFVDKSATLEFWQKNTDKQVLFLFFLIGYAILKDFSYVLGRDSTVENSTGDVMTIDQ